MKINFILSDTTKKATTMALASATKKAEDFSKNILVIVPETKSIIIEREILSLTKNGACANIFVYSFVRLLSRMANVSPESTLSKQACVVLLRKIILDNAANLVCFSKSARSVGFAEKIYDTISQLKSSDISPEDILAALPNFSPSLKAKMTDISLLYREYQGALQGKFLDDCDRLALIKNFVKSSEFIGGSDVFVVGFDNITAEMESVIKSLATHAHETTLSCVYFDRRRKDAHIQKNELYEKYKRIADELKYPYNPTMFRTFESGDFYAISNFLFSTEKKKFKPQGNVSVFEAKNVKQEIDFAANVIARGVREGKRFKDFGLFLCNLEDDYKLVEECFERYQIPYFINRQHNISNHFLAKFVTSAFALVQKRLSCDEVKKFVMNALFGDENLSYFLNFVTASGINYSGFLAEPNYEFSCDEERDSVLSILSKIREFYVEFEQKIMSCVTASDFISAINFIFSKFNVASRLVELSAHERELGDIIGAEITQSILAKHEKFCKILINFLGDTKLSSGEFLQIYLTGFGQIKVNLSPVSIDCVIVQNNTDGFFGIKQMIIVGATSENFPAKIEDKGIVLDSELSEAKSVIKKAIEPLVSTINARENFRAFEALLEPTEKLYITYSLKSKGGSCQPARIISQLKELFGEEIITKSYEKCDFISPKWMELEFAEHLCDYIISGIGLEKLRSEFCSLSENSRFVKWIENLKFEAQNFVVPEAGELYFAGDNTSVSQLENYFACPYQFFANYGLRLRENKNAKISGLDIGNVVHSVVELFGKNINEFKNLEAGEFGLKVDRLLGQALAENNIKRAGNSAVIRLISKECRRLCANIMQEQQSSNFKLFKPEFKFGESGKVFIEPNGKKITLQGKIDRIDTFDKFVRIIDYKTGDVSSNLESIYFGKKIQLASYLIAVKNILKAEVAGLFYLPIHSDYAKQDSRNHYRLQGFMLDDIDVIKNMDVGLDENKLSSNFVPLKIKLTPEGIGINKQGNVSERFLSSTDFENLADYVLKLAGQAASEILSGNIEPSPIDGGKGKGERCERCALRGFCGLENAKFPRGRRFDAQVGKTSFKTTSKGETADGQN